MIAVAFGGTARFVWSRNRVLLLAFGAVYLAIFIAYQIWSPDLVHRSLPQTTFFMRLAPFLLPLLVLVGSVNVATARLSSRQGYFPRLFYTLPIKTHEMVMPFITYCVALTAALWLVGGILSHWRILKLGPPGTPAEAERISYWLPFLITSGLVWFQALAWTPARAGWTRVCAFLVVTLAHFVVVFLCAVGSVTPNQVVVLSLLQIPLAFLVAMLGVARDRSGFAQDEVLRRPGVDDKSEARLAKASKHRPLRSFSSAMDAQFWFESQIRRRTGVGIAILPVLLLVILVVLSALGRNLSNPDAFGVVARIAITMFLWALIAFGAANGSLFASFRSVTGWQYKEAFAMPAFFAALPMSTGDFVWVKLTSVTKKMLWFSVAAVLACGWIASAAGLIDFASGTVLALRQQHGNFIAVTLVVMPVIAFILLLLTCTTNVMSFSLGGRAFHWVNGMHFSRYLIIGLGGALVGMYWGEHRVPPPGLSEIVRALAIVKILTLAWLVWRVGELRLLSWRRLATVLAFWLATAGTLLTTALVFPPNGRISTLTLAALLIVLSPVQGTVSAPLALQLNRAR